MTNHRVERLAGELKKELASILDREIKDPRLGMVSIVAINIAPDGCSAKIYVSPLMADANHAEVASALNSAKGYIRRELGKRLRTRIIPELYFHVDESIAYGVDMIRRVNEQISEDKKAAEGRPPFDESIYKE